MNPDIDETSAFHQRFAEVFARLSEQDIEQFYAHYQLWVLRRRIPLIAGQIGELYEHSTQNQQLIDSLRPSVIAQAVLARLQASGISDVSLLDQMLERGEDWLDRMMQRLDYCEQVEDFIQGDYTQWCINSLEGAYDWIDTLLSSVKEEEGTRQSNGDGAEATEEQLLQKLRLDDEEAALKSEQPADEESLANEQTRSNANETSLETAEQSLLAKAEIPGQGTASAEQLPELADWEEIETPQERPAPWYSVNLAESASAEAATADTMQDWISLLQSDASPSAATNETTTETGEERKTSEAIFLSDEDALSEPAEVPVDRVVEYEEPVQAGLERAEEDSTIASESSTTAPLNKTEQSEVEAAHSKDERAPASSDELENREQLDNEAANEAGSRESEQKAAIEESRPLLIPDETTSAVTDRVSEEMDRQAEEAADKEERADGQEAERAPEADKSEYPGETPKEDIRDEIDAQQPLEAAILDVTGPDAPPEAEQPAIGSDETDLQQAETGATALPEQSAEDSLEEAAIVNDILGREEEHIPWYEYLETGEQAPVQEQPAPAAAEEESASLKTPGEANQGPDEISDWQAGQGDQEDEQTLPMALREIRAAQEQQVPGERKEENEENGETPEEIKDEVPFPEAPEENEPAGVTAVDASDERSEDSRAGQVALPETPVQVLADEEQNPEAILPSEERRQLVTPPVTTQQGNPPRKKLSFWQRLFSRRRKKG